MLAAVTAPTPANGAAEGLEARNQIRLAISSSEIPKALMCGNQAPVQTEVALADAPAANSTSMAPNSTAVAPNNIAVAPISTAVAA